MKGNSSQQQGILQELMELMLHEIRRILQYLWGGDFISDDFLATELAKRLHQAPTTVARALNDYTDIALGNCMKVLVTCTHPQPLHGNKTLDYVMLLFAFTCVLIDCAVPLSDLHRIWEACEFVAFAQYLNGTSKDGLLGTTSQFPPRL